MNSINQLTETKKTMVNSTRITIKLIIIVVLTLLLLIPQFMVKNLVKERGNRQIEVTNNIANQIGGEQKIVGPILCIPYYNEVEQVMLNEKNQKIKELIQVKEYLYISPNQLNINSEVQVENKEKSIYKVPVFQSKNTLTVSFGEQNIKSLLNNSVRFNAEDAFLVIGTSNNKGVTGTPSAIINDKKESFQPGEQDVDIFRSGIHLPVNVEDVLNNKPITIQLEFRGTSALNFGSIAKTNELTMTSNWAHPNFETTLSQNYIPNDYDGVPNNVNSMGYELGNSLPLDSHKEITENGFTAKWQESQFGMNHKETWTSSEGKPNLYGRLMGTKFINVADHYSKTDRSVKYMALIIGLVFVSFFIIELIKGQRVHPFQYIMIGTSIVIFFVLLLALSEYLGFNLSYIIASIATSALVGLYSLGVFQSKNLASSIALLLIFLFTFIFVILIAVEYSLIIGAIGLFIILAIIMYVTRNIKWYNE